jgi:putative lipoic acid-binding regulatory protein
MKKVMPMPSHIPKILNNSEPPTAPKIEFPCENYPIKVIGHNVADFQDYVLQVMFQYDTTLDLTRVSHKDSKNGKFRSVRLFMTAQSEQQLMDLNAEFKASGKVVTVI